MDPAAPDALEEFFESNTLQPASLLPAEMGASLASDEELQCGAGNAMAAPISVLNDMLKETRSAEECFGIILGRNGIIELAEGSTDRLLGISKEHLVGQSILSLVALGERHRVCRLLPSASGALGREMECEFISFRTGNRISLELKSRLLTTNAPLTGFYDEVTADKPTVGQSYVVCVAKRGSRPLKSECSQQSMQSAAHSAHRNADGLMPAYAKLSSSPSLEMRDTPNGVDKIAADKKITRRAVEGLERRSKAPNRSAKKTANHEWLAPTVRVEQAPPTYSSARNGGDLAPSISPYKSNSVLKSLLDARPSAAAIRPQMFTFNEGNGLGDRGTEHELYAGGVNYSSVRECADEEDGRFVREGSRKKSSTMNRSTPRIKTRKAGRRKQDGLR